MFKWAAAALGLLAAACTERPEFSVASADQMSREQALDADEWAPGERPKIATDAERLVRIRIVPSQPASFADFYDNNMGIVTDVFLRPCGDPVVEAWGGLSRSPEDRDVYEAYFPASLGEMGTGVSGLVGWPSSFGAPDGICMQIAHSCWRTGDHAQGAGCFNLMPADRLRSNVMSLGAHSRVFETDETSELRETQYQRAQSDDPDACVDNPFCDLR